MGAGAGLAADLDGPGSTDLTLFAALGGSVRAAAGWEILGELRVRSVDPWTGTTADMLGGLQRF